MNKHHYQTIVSWLGSRKFFILLLIIFSLEAMWVAFSGRFPMAFDEDFHLGIIQIYARHFNPFFLHQPAGADMYGALARDPSYLYHYLMSFPWRLITHLTHNFMTQVIIMRLINIMFFAGSLVSFRALLFKTKLSKALVHVTLLFFILTPLVPQVAAQINYDNLFILLTSLSLLLTFQLVEKLKTRHTVHVPQLVLLLCLCLLTSLVKYPFLPIFLAIVIYLVISLHHTWQIDKTGFKKNIAKNFQTLGAATKLLLFLGFILSSGLFIERYGVNTVRYGTPLPECDQVLNIARCSAYGPWERNYLLEQSKNGHTNPNPIHFTYLWGRKLGYNLMFALNGQMSGYKVGKPLPLPRIVARTVAYLSPLLILIFWKKIFASPSLRFFALVTTIYIVALWLLNYGDYLHLDQQVAIQGRYLFPVLLFIYLMCAMAWSQLFQTRAYLKVVLASVALLCFIIGGGVLTFIIHSDPAWYWPNPSVIRFNQEIQHILDPVIPGSHYVPS